MTDESASTPGWVLLERHLDASIETVWARWTDPVGFAGWYGPGGATIPTAEMDVAVGGRRLICMEMQTPDGPHRMWFTGEYLEVEEPTRLVYTDAMCDPDGNPIAPADMGMPADAPTSTEVIVELSEAGDRTALKLTHVGVPADSPGATGWSMALDKLASAILEHDQ